MARFGFGIAAWYKSIRRGSLRAVVKSIRVDWAAVQEYYDAGHTYSETRARFGFFAEGWRKAVKRGDIKSRPLRWPLERILAESKSRFSIKRRLMEAGLLVNRCDECGLTSWRGRPLSNHLDHRNGIKGDHRLENLRMLCPNCHSQTSTFGARNRKQNSANQRKQSSSRVV